MSIKINKSRIKNLKEIEILYNDLINYLNESNKIVGSIILNHKPEERYEKVTWNSPNDYVNMG